MDNKQYRLILSNTEVFSIALQENIKFSKDIIVSISNNYNDFSNDEQIFAKKQISLFNDTSLLDKANGDLIINIKNTLPYNKKDIEIFSYTFKRD